MSKTEQTKKASQVRDRIENFLYRLKDSEVKCFLRNYINGCGIRKPENMPGVNIPKNLEGTIVAYVSVKQGLPDKILRELKRRTPGDNFIIWEQPELKKIAN